MSIKPGLSGPFFEKPVKGWNSKGINYMPSEQGYFKKGNQAGKRRIFLDALSRSIAQHDNPEVLRSVADTLVNQAVAGESWAIKELIDRLDGKPVQAQEIEMDASLTVEIVKFAEITTTK